jgi:inosose dehydratase
MRWGFIAQNDLPGIEADCRFAVEHGFEGLEFNYWAGFKDLTADTVGEMRAILDRYGIKCSTFGIWGWNHLASDPPERETSHMQLGRAIEFAKTMGAPTLIIGGGQEGDKSLDENIASFADVMRPFIDRAKAAGLQVALYGFHGNSFLQTVEAYERLWEAVPDVVIKFDPANVDHAGEDYLAVLRKHADRVYHVHIKEHLNYGGEIASQPAAGMGDIAWGKVMAFLHEADYKGYLTIEPHGSLWGQGALRRKMLILSKRYIDQFLV